ncbi:MAG: hypothetical protein M3O88_01315 [Actinomycetota bacterium]|nr:hypothetical protein [Actinomycetota bacterium]
MRSAAGLNSRMFPLGVDGDDRVESRLQHRDLARLARAEFPLAAALLGDVGRAR